MSVLPFISVCSRLTDRRADFIYMAPPFIAYYGAIQGGDNGTALLTEAYTQCKLYRQYLSDDSGLWKHIVLGSWQDNNHWGTGKSGRHVSSCIQTYSTPR